MQLKTQTRNESVAMRLMAKTTGRGEDGEVRGRPAAHPGRGRRAQGGVERASKRTLLGGTGLLRTCEVIWV